MTATRARQCGRKKAHATRTEAKAHHTRLIADGAHPDAHAVYRCHRCRRWHVGHRMHRRHS